MINFKVPIAWSILRERIGMCLRCKYRTEFKNWRNLWPLLYVRCPKCDWELEVKGAARDFHR